MTRRLVLFSFVLLAITALVPARSAAADPAYRVIVNPDNPTTSLGKDQVAKMLLKKTTT